MLELNPISQWSLFSSCIIVCLTYSKLVQLGFVITEIILTEKKRQRMTPAWIKLKTGSENKEQTDSFESIWNWTVGKVKKDGQQIKKKSRETKWKERVWDPRLLIKWDCLVREILVKGGNGKD